MSSTLPIVYIVDDDPSVLKAASRLLRLAGLQVMTFASAKRFLEDHNPEASGCLVLDLALPDLSGLELQEILADRGSALPVIFMTGCGDIPTSVHAMKAGAIDFLTKPVADDDLIRAVREALDRNRVTTCRKKERADIQARLQSLTPREHDVLRQIIAGKLNKQAAAELGTGEKTIKVHRAKVMRKMKAPSLADLVRMTERVGI